MEEMTKQICKAPILKGTIRVPGDKSISHRAVMFGSIAEGDTVITHFLPSADCLATIDCMRKLGVKIEILPDDAGPAHAAIPNDAGLTHAAIPNDAGLTHADISNNAGLTHAAIPNDAGLTHADNASRGMTVIVHGRGLRGLSAPAETLDAGNSGTTTRLLSGILAGQPFESRLTGDASLTGRPMKRIIDPLTRMGAHILSEKNNGCAPLLIGGQPLYGIDYLSPVASAQVKSCVLLAGLYADGTTSVTEPALSRDHTERMLRTFGVDVRSDGLTASLVKPKDTPHNPGSVLLRGRQIDVPGDISSAAYFLAAGLLIPGSAVLLENVGINPTRDGILKVIEMMGGQVEILNRRILGGSSDSDCDRGCCDGDSSSGSGCDRGCDRGCDGDSSSGSDSKPSRGTGEPVADLRVTACPLHGAEIGGAIIPTLIDEIPVIAVMAAFAQGTTVIRDAAELKVKETDRLALITENLTAMGADVTATDDGLIIKGRSVETLHGARIKTLGDHRMAMAFAIAGLLTGDIEIDDPACVAVSYPSFFEELEALTGK